MTYEPLPTLGAAAFPAMFERDGATALRQLMDALEEAPRRALKLSVMLVLSLNASDAQQCEAIALAVLLLDQAAERDNKVRGLLKAMAAAASAPAGTA
jgi:hypothetical protein